jgi:hypothetical protein
MRAQIQLIGVGDPHGARLAILSERQAIIDIANSRDQLLNELVAVAATSRCTSSRIPAAAPWW